MPLQTNKQELRKFGLVMAGAFGALGLYFWWKSGFAAWPRPAVIMLGISSFFALTGLFIPILLSPIEFVWMKIAHVMGFVMTRVLLTIVFFAAIMPTGLIFRLRGKDLLQKNLDPDAPSYWVPAEEDGPWTRPEKPY